MPKDNLIELRAIHSVFAMISPLFMEASKVLGRESSPENIKTIETRLQTAQEQLSKAEENLVEEDPGERAKELELQKRIYHYRIDDLKFKIIELKQTQKLASRLIKIANKIAHLAIRMDKVMETKKQLSEKNIAFLYEKLAEALTHFVIEGNASTTLDSLRKSDEILAVISETLTTLEPKSRAKSEKEKQIIQEFMDDRHSTHRHAVHVSSAASLLKLEEKYKQRLEDQYGLFPVWQVEIMAKRIILPELDKALTNNQITSYEYKLAKEFINDVVLKKYIKEVEQYSGKTLLEALIYSYQGIIDEKSMQAQPLSDSDIQLRKIGFFKELAILSKEYAGGDPLSLRMQQVHGGPEACFGGLFNGVVAYLEHKHDSVKIVRDVALVSQAILEDTIRKHLETLSSEQQKVLRDEFALYAEDKPETHTANILALLREVRAALHAFRKENEGQVKTRMFDDAQIDALVQTVQYHPELQPKVTKELKPDFKLEKHTRVTHTQHYKAMIELEDAKSHKENRKTAAKTKYSPTSGY